MIPYIAAQRIFLEVWSEYLARSESDTPDAISVHFRLDVESCIRRLYPDPAEFAYIHSQLLDHFPRVLPATRAALGDAFLTRELWPVRQYFDP